MGYLILKFIVLITICKKRTTGDVACDFNRIYDAKTARNWNLIHIRYNCMLYYTTVTTIIALIVVIVILYFRVNVIWHFKTVIHYGRRTASVVETWSGADAGRWRWAETGVSANSEKWCKPDWQTWTDVGVGLSTDKSFAVVVVMPLLRLGDGKLVGRWKAANPY